MKKLIFFALLFVLVWACTHQKELVKSDISGPTVSADSTEYEIIIIDPGFDQWYQLNYSPAKDRNNEYYRSKNILGVNNWNQYYLMSNYHRIVETQINFDPSVDYGMEVNRKLFWYFRFIEEKFKIRLLS